MQGVPLRLEIGPADLEKKQTLSVRRDTGAKSAIPLSDLASTIPALLETIQSDMFNRAKAEYDSRLKPVTDWKEVVPTLDDKCIVVMPWCEEIACEDDIKERSAAAYVFHSHHLYTSGESDTRLM